MKDRNADAIDPLICQIDSLREAQRFVETYPGLATFPADPISATAAALNEQQVQQWSARIRTEVGKLLSLGTLANTPHRSEVEEGYVESKRLGKYPYKLTRAPDSKWTSAD